MDIMEKFEDPNWQIWEACQDTRGGVSHSGERLLIFKLKHRLLEHQKEIFNEFVYRIWLADPTLRGQKLSYVPGHQPIQGLVCD